jgi:hypothetical protein
VLPGALLLAGGCSESSSEGAGGAGGVGASAGAGLTGESAGTGGAMTAGAAGNASGASGGSGGSGTGGGAGAGGGAGVSGSGGASGAGAAGASGAGAGGASGAAGAAGSPGASGSAGEAAGGGAGVAGAGGVTTLEAVDIADVWSGHPVKFALLTHETRQFAAFYDADRNLTVADRTLGTTTWKLVRLPTAVGWDSHNDIVMAVDDDGYLHVSGNMHSSPLIYFRTSSPLDIDTFEQLPMVNMNEASCTYPQFFRSPAGELVFMYRDGSSGNGNHIFNAYDTATKTWRRLLGSALTDGEGQLNAYPVGPIQGPDGLFHLVWVWRDTPDASTNHDLSYAKTANLLDWTAADGSPVALPIRLATGDVVDPVPAMGGMINNNTKVGFDAQNRPIVVYHKYDESGNTQLYNARFEDGAWVVHKTTEWSYRWEFGGGGTLVFEIEVEPVALQPDGTLTQNYYHAEYGGLGAFRLDPVTLEAVEDIPVPVPYPPDLADVESTTPEMVVRWQSDAAVVQDENARYMLRWETLPSNRDQPRDVIPPPTKLRLYGFSR